MSLILLPTPVLAQRVSIGAVAGGTSTVFTSQSNMGQYDWGRGYGTILGAGATLQLTRILGLRAEALLLERASDGGKTMRVRYDEFPVLAVFTPGGRFSRASLLLGASTAVERSCRLHVWEVSGIPEDPRPAQRYEQDCRLDRTNRRNFGLTGGIQYAHPIAGGRLEVGLRYTDGQTDLAHEYSCCSLQTRTTALTIGYSTAIVR